MCVSVCTWDRVPRWQGAWWQGALRACLDVAAGDTALFRLFLHKFAARTKAESDRHATTHVNTHSPLQNIRFKERNAMSLVSRNKEVNQWAMQSTRRVIMTSALCQTNLAVTYYMTL